MQPLCCEAETGAPMTKRAPRLTQDEIDAICEALTARTAGPLDIDDGQPLEVYESALDKMSARLKQSKSFMLFQSGKD